MADYLKVTGRGSIQSCVGERRTLNPGEKLERDECIRLVGGKQEVDRLVDQGYLVRLYEETDPNERKLPPQTSQSPPHPSDLEVDEKRGKHGMQMANRGPRERVEPAVKVTPSPWTLDKSELEGKDVHELNVMIAERTAQDEKPFVAESAEDAILWLTQDA